ncbi:MAG: DnaA N-terminal domain-containing protein, partial [Thermoguttaceae bacterium]
MVARRQTDLGTLFQEALRAHIGESRYQMWFGSGVRFAFEGNALTALVDTPFMVDWLKDGYARVFAQVGKDLFGQEITVSVVQAESSPNIASSKRSPKRANPSNLIEPESGVTAAAPIIEAASSVPTPQTPKRKRGRPRKNVIIAQPVAPEQTTLAPAPEPTFFDAYDPLLEAKPESAPTQQPVKRKRGRPRKNPLPETAPSDAPASFQPQTVAQLSALNPPKSFLNEFNETATLRFPQRQTRQTSNAFPNLSDSERVAWVVGDFDDSDVPASVGDVVERKPGKRGRPKGSTNRVRRPAQANDAPFFPVRQPEQAPRALFETRPEQLSQPSASPAQLDLSEEEEIVSRNARGANFVTRPKGAPRVQAVSDRTTQFAR